MIDICMQMLIHRQIMSIQIQLMTLTCFSLSVSWDLFHGQFLNFGFSPQGALVFGSVSIMQQPVIHVILVPWHSKLELCHGVSRENKADTKVRQIRIWLKEGLVVSEHFECEELLVGHVWTMDSFLHMCTLLEVLFSLCVSNCEVLQWQAVTTKLSWVLQKFVFSSVPFDPWGFSFCDGKLQLQPSSGVTQLSTRSYLFPECFVSRTCFI
jgi:hypothetical protein